MRDRLYVTGDVGDDLLIFAFDLAGKPLWRQERPLVDGLLPRGTGLLRFFRGRLYHMNAHGRVACLDAETGRELWAVDVRERFGGQDITWGMSECLLVDGPRVLVTPAGEKALMAALDKQNGRTLGPPNRCSAATGPRTPLPAVAVRRAAHRGELHLGQRVAVDADSGKLLLDGALAQARMA